MKKNLIISLLLVLMIIPINANAKSLYDTVKDLSTGKDVTDLGRWGNGDVEIGFDSLAMLDATMEIIKQALDKQKKI